MASLHDFSEMPNEFRMRAREIVDNAGGSVASYCDGSLDVALPSDTEACAAMSDELIAMGLMPEAHSTWFPLGSDNPPASMRHFGTGTAACPRGDRPGYWRYRRFFVTEAGAA